MAFEYKRIDVDSHCQEKPDTWTSRMSKAKWGDRIPQIVEKDGRETWLCDGKVMMNGWLALCHGVIPDRKSLPTHWRDVPSMIYINGSASVWPKTKDLCNARRRFSIGNAT